MTQHIKCVAIVLLLLFLSCSENTIVERGNEKKSVVSLTSNKAESFTFIKSFQFCDNPNAAFTSDEANEIYREKVIKLDPTNTRISLNWASFFYEGSKLCVEEEIGEKHTSSYLISTTDNFPFDQIVLFNKKYILFAQDGFFFVFKGAGLKNESSNTKKAEQLNLSRMSFKSIVQGLVNQKELSFPVEYSYDFVTNLDGFMPINDVPSIKEFDHLSDFEFAKLHSIGETKLLLTSGYMESGQTEIHLIVLNGLDDVVETMLLYTSQDTEDGNILTRFTINDDYLVTILKEERGQGGAVNKIEEKSIKIQDDGSIVLIKP